MAIGLLMGSEVVHALGHEAVASARKGLEKIIGARSLGKQAAGGLGGYGAFATVTDGLHGGKANRFEAPPPPRPSPKGEGELGPRLRGGDARRIPTVGRGGNIRTPPQTKQPLSADQAKRAFCAR